MNRNLIIAVLSVSTLVLAVLQVRRGREAPRGEEPSLAAPAADTAGRTPPAPPVVSAMEEPMDDGGRARPFLPNPR